MQALLIVSALLCLASSKTLTDLLYPNFLGTTLFNNVFASSPYLPEQYGYADWVPSQSYYAFANYVGCFDGTAYGFETKPQSIFKCLTSKDTHTLQNGSFYISSTANYGVSQSKLWLVNLHVITTRVGDRRK